MESFFKVSLVLQRFFRKLVWRFADYLNDLPPSVIDLKDPNVVQKTINSFMEKVYTLSKMVRTEELDESIDNRVLLR